MLKSVTTVVNTIFFNRPFALKIRRGTCCIRGCTLIMISGWYFINPLATSLKKFSKKNKSYCRKAILWNTVQWEGKQNAIVKVSRIKVSIHLYQKGEHIGNLAWLSFQIQIWLHCCWASYKPYKIGMIKKTMEVLWACEKLKLPLLYTWHET